MATVEKLQEHLKKTQSNLAEASKKDDAGEIRKLKKKTCLLYTSPSPRDRG